VRRLAERALSEMSRVCCRWMVGEDIRGAGGLCVGEFFSMRVVHVQDTESRIEFGSRIYRLGDGEPTSCATTVPDSIRGI